MKLYGITFTSLGEKFWVVIGSNYFYCVTDFSRDCLWENYERIKTILDNYHIYNPQVIIFNLIDQIEKMSLSKQLAMAVLENDATAIPPLIDSLLESDLIK